MKLGIKYPIGQIKRKPDRKAESLEESLRKMIEGKEPIEGGAKIEYTERKDGVLPQYDIRTDRFNIALEASDKVHRSEYAKRLKVDNPELVEVQLENGKPKAES